MIILMIILYLCIRIQKRGKSIFNSIYPGCGVVNPLGVTATSTRIMGVNTSTSTLFGEFPWMVAILEKTDTGSSR
jgi:hypothetical protein